MSKFTLKWFCGKIFDEFESRDFIVIVIVAGLFTAIMCDKIPAENITALITGVAGYALGRPNTGGGEEK